jgi:hypothetical protein
MLQNFNVNHNRSRPRRRPRCKYVDNIKMNHNEYDYVVWTDLAQDAPGNTALNILLS